MRLPLSIVSGFASLCLLAAASTTALAQAPSGNEATQAEPYASFASASPAASDPADSVCLRRAPGSAVASPTSLYSSNGVLQTTFYFDTVVDASGLTRYCYIAQGGYEGPTLRVNPGDQLMIHFYNTVPRPASAAAMPGMVMDGASPASFTTGCAANGVSSASTNLHFHGLNVPPVCHQDEVVHTIVQPQTNFDYTVQIPSDEPAGLYWYHPHPHGFSQNQVLGGATGAIIIEGIQNFNPIVKQLPERVLVFRDQALTAANQSGPGAPSNDLSLNYIPVTYPNYTPAVINTPVGVKEFWRVANTAANSVINLQILDANVAQPMQVVGVDGVPITDGSGNPTTHSQTSILLPPGARVEFIYTTPQQGHTAHLNTLAWNNGSDGDYDPGRSLATIVSSSSNGGGLPITSGVPVSRIPAVTQSIPAERFRALNTTAATVQRSLYFSYKSDFSQFYITVNGQTPAPFSMTQSPNIVVRSGTVEQWTIQNRSRMDHAFHIHQIHFRTLAVNGASVTDYTLRDTVNVAHWSGNSADPYPSVTVLMDFTSPEIIGTFVYHCHILSHEDLGMMGEIQILPPLVAPSISTSASATAIAPGTSITFTTTVSGGSGTPTGTVTFTTGSTTLGTATLNGSGIASLATTALPKGEDSIVAKYNGNSLYSPATAAAVHVTVTNYPHITRMSPIYGAYGAYTVIYGINFGASKGSSTVTFNGTVASTIVSWSNTSIAVDVPAMSTTGRVLVKVNGNASNGWTFSVYADPVITAISPASGPVGTLLTITGTTLVDGQGHGYALFNGVQSNFTSQTSTRVQAKVPSGATTGGLHIHANGVGSNNITFTVK